MAKVKAREISRVYATVIPRLSPTETVRMQKSLRQALKDGVSGTTVKIKVDGDATQAATYSATAREFSATARELKNIGHVINNTAKMFGININQFAPNLAGFAKNMGITADGIASFAIRAAPIAGVVYGAAKALGAYVDHWNQTWEWAGNVGNQALEFVGNIMTGIGDIGSNILNTIGNALTTAANMFIDLLKEGVYMVAGLVTDVIAESFNQFITYQQSYEGMQVIFDGATESMEKYANQAWFTAGSSAQNYYEQATLFGNAIKRTIGDMEDVVDLVDMAMTDMADNINRFGSDPQIRYKNYLGALAA